MGQKPGKIRFRLGAFGIDLVGTPAKAREIGAMVIGGIMVIIGTIIGIGTPVLPESVFTFSATRTITMIRRIIRSRTIMTMDNTESRRMYRLRLPGSATIGE